MRGTRILAALAAAIPIFTLAPWIQVTAVDQPANVQAGRAFTATVQAFAHIDDAYWPPDPGAAEGGAAANAASAVPPVDQPPSTTGTVNLRLGVLVPSGWQLEAVDYTITDSPLVPVPSAARGLLTPTPDETWAYDVYSPPPDGYSWQAFGGVQVDVTSVAQVRFAVTVRAGHDNGRYRLVYGTWSHPPYAYATRAGGVDAVRPPGDSLLPVPPPSFVQADITVGDMGPAPRVVSIAPPDGAADVPVDTDIRLTFDRDMDLASLRDGGVQLFAGPVYYPTGRGGGPDDATSEPAWRLETPLDPGFRIPPWEPWPIPVQIFWNPATKTAVVDPIEDLAGHAVHTILVTYRARAVDGAAVDTIRSAAFLTERTPPTPFFADVPAEHRFRQAIETLFDAGIASGYADNTFRPENPVTREQLATMLVRLLGLHTPEPDGPPPFRDLPSPATDQGADYVGEAARAGIVTGLDDGTFRPHDSVTRIQMTRMIVRAGQLSLAAPPPDYSAGFADVEAADQGFVNWAAYNHLADGKATGVFDPWSTATRGHATRLLYGLWSLLPRPLAIP